MTTPGDAKILAPVGQSVGSTGSPAVVRPPTRVRLEEALEVATEAYVYAYPLVLMETARRIVADAGIAASPINRFCHARTLASAATNGQTPGGADMMNSRLWLNLAREPMVVTVPDSGGRYFLMPIFDMWTNVFASPGSRTTGGHAQHIAVVGPNWRGSIPKGFDIIKSPTTHALMIVQMQTKGPEEYPALHAFQDGLLAEPLSQVRALQKQPKLSSEGELDFSPPVQQVARLSGAKFFTLFLETTKLDQPRVDDSPILSRMKRIGLEPGKAIAIDALPLTVKSALHDAPKAALPQIMDAAVRSARNANGWAITWNPVGTYGADYLKRAGMAYAGLGANTIEDVLSATLDERSCKQTLDSGGYYRLHFEHHQIPPVRAFWSLTMYNNRQLLASNPIDRYAIGDRDALQRNSDGSLDLYLQRESPGAERESNWLPTPQRGAFSLKLRLYWPKGGALDGTWAPPPILKFR